MKQAVVVDCVRTPIGRSHKNMGVFRDVRGDDLAVAVIRALVRRTGIDPVEIEDVVMGVTGQQGEQGFNVARIISLMSGLPAAAGGTTINRLCGSSLQAINQAAHAIISGAEDVQIVGGMEHMLRVPMETSAYVNPRLYETTPENVLLMGNTAEFLAQSRGISRKQQDEFSVRSHQRAAAAQAAGGFKREIVPVGGHDRKGNAIMVDADQCVRPDCNVELLGGLNPAFLPVTGTVTAGNSSPLNDGAAALLMMSAEKAQALGLKPLVKIRSTAVTGVDPREMGLGPIGATDKVLRRGGLQLGDIDLIELNEAFASQVLACLQCWDIDEERLNVRGGAIAIGHPLGASGARIATTLIHNMIDRDATLGLATMCIGVGQGIATIFERC